MCTAIILQHLQGGKFFGGTMDFSYPIEPGLYVTTKITDCIVLRQ